jgi:putative transposase
VVEVCHSGFNRFRKLLLWHEQLDPRFLALNRLAVAIIAFRKVPAQISIICG